jgi:hypothetical protein
VDVFLLHASAVGADEFDPDFGLVGEEDKHLVSWIVVVMDKDNQVGSRWTFFTRRIKKNNENSPGKTAIPRITSVYRRTDP